MKRWIDAGEVRAVRTSGGHRRVSQAEAVRYIRERRLDIVDPSALGISGLDRPVDDQHRFGADTLVEGFLSDDAARAERMLLAAYLRGASLPSLFDGPVRTAMNEIGQMWRDGHAGIMYEHRATDILIRALSRIRSLQPVHAEAPVAVGGAISEDPYLLPSLMAATVLAESGFAVTNLGPDTPPATLIEATRRLGADFLWLSVSISIPEEQLVRELRAITSETAPRPLALGGRGVEARTLPAIDSVYLLPSMHELSALAEQTIMASA